MNKRPVIVASAAALLTLGVVVGALIDHTAGARDAPPKLDLNLVQRPADPTPAPRATGAVATRQELCNGLDDDANGVADGEFGLLGHRCDGNADKERCGTYRCADDGRGVVCDESAQGPCLDGERGVPCVEVCDGADNDCDGRIDVGRDSNGTRIDFRIGQPCEDGGCKGTIVCAADGLTSVCVVECVTPEPREDVR